jgi:low affinity Fe/Cu permease
MKEEDFRTIVLFLFAILVMLTIFIIQNCDKKDNIKLDYEIETYIDD